MKPNQTALLFSCFALSILISSTGIAQWSLTGNTPTTAQFLGTTNATNLRIRTNNTERMVILSSGNVGIGITNPANKLHIVHGTTGLSGLRFGSLTSTFAPVFSANGKVLTVDANGDVVLTTGVSNFSAGSLSPLFTTGVATSTTTPALSFTLSTQTANTIFAGPSSGGVAAPSFRALSASDIPNLDAAKITTGILPVARGGIGLVLGTADQQLRVNAAGTALEYFTPSGEGTNYWTLSGSDIYNNTAGNVGIGGTAPAYKLDVTGSFRTTADARINNMTVGTGGSNSQYNTVLGQGALAANTPSGIYNTAIGYQALTSNTTGTINTAVGYASLVSNTGGNYNTGIGANSLSSNTTGTGNTAVGYISMQLNQTGSHNTAIGYNSLKSNTTGNYNSAMGRNALSASTTASYNTAFGFGSQNFNTTGGSNTSTGAQTLYSNITGSANTADGMNALYYNTAGGQNTAIGVNSLYANTAGNNNTAIGSNALANTTTSIGNVAVGYFAGSTLTGGDNNILIGTSVQPNISTTASNQLNIGNWIYGDNGNIGIGVTVPSARLHSNGTVRFQGLANNNSLTQILATDASGNVSWRDASTFGGGGGGSSQWITAGSDIYYNTGNVGIGIANPTSKLYVSGTGGLPAVFSDAGVGASAIQVRNGNGYYADFGVEGAGIVSIKSNNTVFLYGNSAGKVGIGTTSMADNNYKLFVETGIRTRKVKVDQTVWADYVFYPGYILPPLKDVEDFIQKNKHLPDVPSAAEVEKNGLDLGENQATLLKKIEELTLYMIELNKKVEKLSEENAVLKKKLEAANK
ncbi:MAG: hypothetical protein JNK14_16065 [Chitinophagaceae bacterium]|nr:hypothetical protein [Chitinophagaceae bacterium]